MRERFEVHLVNEIEKYKGLAFPVKCGTLHRILFASANIMKLHPNPDDEFSKPEVGPSYRIVSDYETQLRYHPEIKFEPIIVEKMHPDGYLIINGHHRWAAFYRLGYKRVPIEIVNMAHEDDIIKMIETATNDKRVTLDLDEVVFCKSDDEPSEAKPGFPFGHFFKERIRLGIPALFHYLSNNGYDIWVYSSKFYSIDYIRNYMKRYHVNVTGIVTGTEKKNNRSESAQKNIDKMIAGKYKYTLNVDDDMVLLINNETKEFVEHEINKEKGNWSQGVINILEQMKEDA